MLSVKNIVNNIFTYLVHTCQLSCFGIVFDIVTSSIRYLPYLLYKLWMTFARILDTQLNKL